VTLLMGAQKQEFERMTMGGSIQFWPTNECK
jgi:hypothetical protein